MRIHTSEMKVYSHSDPEIESILQRIPRIAQQVKATNLPYWVFVLNSNPIGIAVVGKEPTQLIASPGTPMAFVNLLKTELPKENIEAFVTEALELVSKKNVEYVLAKFRFSQDIAINQFKEADFREFDDCYQMVCKLNKSFKPSTELQMMKVKKEQMHQFILLAERFLQGSPDIALKKALEHIPELPDEFLDQYYTMEEFYIAYKEEQPIGILDLNTTKGLISNVGVDPQQRGIGYGRQIMLFALAHLRNSGCEQAYLRVHVENKPAVHLYELLGFVSAERYKRLIWWR